MNSSKRYLQFGCLILTLVVFGLHGCQTTSFTSGKNITHKYRTEGEKKLINPQFCIAHQESQIARLFFRVNLNELNETEDGSKSFSLRYRLNNNYSSTIPVDSNFQVFKNLNGDWYEGAIVVPIPSNRNYMMEIDIIDLYSTARTRSYVDIINPMQFSRQSFVLQDTNGQMLFSSVVPTAGKYRIKTSGMDGPLYLRHYSRNFPIAAPPFSAVNNKPFDFTPEAFAALRQIENGVFEIDIAHEGIYQIVEDTGSKGGGSVYYFGMHYPMARTVNDLFLPLRYITTSPEYHELKKSENLKKGIDNYWLTVAGTPDRAKMLIKTYYGRVEVSNQLFDSYIEGWKTDRGMCYIVYGPPSKVVRSTASETWLYGEDDRYSALKLTFTKVYNPFSNNDFRLNRNASLKSSWYRSVEFWRQGRIITY